MRKLLLLVFLLGTTLSINAQEFSFNKVSVFDRPIHYFENAPIIEDAMAQKAISLGLEPNQDLIETKNYSDDIGMQHIHYLQFHEGILIEGAHFKVHGRNGIATHANQHLIKGIQLSSSPSISAENSISIAMEEIGMKEKMWEDKQMDSWLKKAKEDPNASWKPIPELLYCHKKSSPIKDELFLAWKMDLHSSTFTDGKVVYVDAQTGEVLDILETCHSGASQGVAVTRYSGTQNITTDSVSPNLFTLIDSTRGGGIRTLNLLNNTQQNLGAAINFEDTDNFWDNANAAKDDAATDAHWGIEQSYDYFLSKHGRNSFDDSGTAITSYVHYDQNVFNAFWFGGLQSMFFGDGSGGSNPLTAIDVAGHELSHGVTQFSAGLIYYGESGALNESYSDIFGTAIEFYSGDPNASWIMGRANFALRDISNPKAFGDPDTYQGANWVSIVGQDAGGVHTNSGVYNYWYYLLSEGGSGVNDIGKAYSVSGLGMDTAAYIAYRALYTGGYLDFLSGYQEAFEGTMQSAIDLYGCGSNEVTQTLNAWKAVGIGGDSINHDMEMLSLDEPIVSGCELGPNEDVTISFIYHQNICGAPILAGEQIPVGVRIRGGLAIQDSYTVPPAGLNDGDTVQFTLSQKLDLSAPGTYRIESWVGYPHDFNSYNDTLKNQGSWQKNATDVKKPLEFGNDFRVGFEKIQNGADTFYVINSRYGTAERQFQAGNTGFFAMRLSADRDADLSGMIPYLDTTINFTINQELLSEMCMCIDASQADSIDFWFDLRQTYSPAHFDSLNQLNFKDTRSSMRVLVDGVQVGPQYHPTTPTDDPYVTIERKLNAFAGSKFKLCFQGEHWYHYFEDPSPDGDGDHTDIDNIRINMYGSALGTQSIFVSKPQFKIYPNPNGGDFNIELLGIDGDEISVQVYDLLGKRVLSLNQLALENGKAQIEGLNPGIYTVQLNNGFLQFQEKVVVR